ncbi:Uncharacterised protein [Mycobacteroides abscessus subsp. abscessus]|nr:Uncharacterised protein [Mycobacteroides abscessus subsp. abscessus]
MGGVWTALYLSGPAGEGPVREPASRSAEPARPGAEPPAPGKPSPRQHSEVPMMILGVVLVGTQLVSLFSEARFSPHEMTQAHRQSAARWLQKVLDDLRSRQ